MTEYEKAMSKPDRRKMAILEITDYRAAPGAKHYYGRLYRGESIDAETVDHAINAKQARDLNRWDRGKHHAWKKGDHTSRFDTEDEVRRAALESWRKSPGNTVILLESSFATGDPAPVLDVIDRSHMSIVTQLNNINTMCDESGRWDQRSNYPTMEKLSSEWHILLAQITGERNERVLQPDTEICAVADPVRRRPPNSGNRKRRGRAASQSD